MAAHSAAYPDNNMIPKWHFGLHAPQQIRDHGHLWGTFANERQHKAFKLAGSAVTNTSAYEASMAKALLNNQLHHLTQKVL
jgi:hypothetical protein